MNRLVLLVALLLKWKGLNMSDVEQRSEEWKQIRLGKFTGSRFKDVLAVSKKDGKPLKAREDLIWQLATERINNNSGRGFSSQATNWGTEIEPFARSAYEFETGENVIEVGFIQHKKYDFVGISPDGLVGEDGGVEFKSPINSSIHLQRAVNGIPDEYVPQCQGFLWVTGRKWIDFVSYDPEAREDFRLIKQRICRDEEFIKNLEKEVLDANKSVNELVEILNKKAA